MVAARDWHGVADEFREMQPYGPVLADPAKAPR
jgi:hypothetical protein